VSRTTHRGGDPERRQSLCKSCATTFVAIRSNQRYCSARCRRKYNQQKVDATKYDSVDQADWERYKKDPQREHEKGDDFVVCRECGEKHTALQRHIVAKHGITVQEYLEKWANPPLIAPSVPDTLRGKHAGKPRRYLRGKKYLGENVQGKIGKEENRNGHAKQEVAPVDDATLARDRMAGKSITEISAEAGLTHGAIVKRLKYIGFPPGGPYLFLHAQPIARKHFDDLRKDFDVDFKEIIEVIGKHPPYEVTKRVTRQSAGWRKGSAGKAPRFYYDCLVNHIKRRDDPADILLARFANIVLDARKRWTEALCFDYRGGRKRIRTFLQSEVRDLPGLMRFVRKPLTDLRAWLQSQNGSIQPHDILDWICQQSRLEVANAAGRDFRTLMFFWPALEDLLNGKRHGWLVGPQKVNEVIYELLAKDYDATAHGNTKRH
jgi:hypothetical protein